MTFVRCLLATLLFASHAYAGDALYFGIRRQFEGTRAQGMGNAFTAVADDNTAIFYNPAGIAQLKEGESNYFIKLDVDPDIQGFVDDVDAASGQNDDVQAITNVIQGKYGEHYSFRGPGLGFLWARPNWGIAFIHMDLSIDMGLNRSVGPSINLVAIQDSTLAFTYSLWELQSKKNGTFNIGITSKLIYRISVDEVVDVASIALEDDIFDENDANEGMTLDFDVGFLWRGPWKRYNPQAAVVIRNVLDYGYFNNMNLVGDGTGDPENLNRVIDLGSSMVLGKWWVWTSRVAFDIRDILHPNWSLRKGIHLGAEFMWDVTSWFRGGWRAGINQGYWTAGFTGELGIFKLDLASYAEEVGIDDEPIENRRYMMTMSLDF